jgi:hypothetical protein
MDDFDWMEWFQRMAGSEQYPMTEPGSAVGGGLISTGTGTEKRYMPQAYFEDTDPMARRPGWRGKIDAGVETVLRHLGVPIQEPGGNMMGELRRQQYDARTNRYGGGARQTRGATADEGIEGMRVGVPGQVGDISNRGMAHMKEPWGAYMRRGGGRLPEETQDWERRDLAAMNQKQAQIAALLRLGPAGR